MKTYPVNVNISYASGRTEKATVREDWMDYRNALEDAMKHGAVMGFSYKRPCDPSATIVRRSV